MTARRLLIGLGNPDRGDDGAGPLVARLVAERGLPGLETHQCRGDVLALLDVWRGHDCVIIVDACAALTAPGTIHRFDWPTSALPPAQSSSTHGIGLAEALALAAALGELPGRITIHAIEGMDFTPGAAISDPVAAAAARLAASF